MSLFSKLFGGSGGKTAEAETYKGYSIMADPMKEAGGFRVAARIEREIDGTVKTHHMVRADVYSSLEDATEATLIKSKALIDEQGDAIFI